MRESVQRCVVTAQMLFSELVHGILPPLSIPAKRLLVRNAGMIRSYGADPSEILAFLRQYPQEMPEAMPERFGL